MMTSTAAERENTILKLDAGLVNRIAAGEVVVRPAAAVKELVENALDAGAKRVEITVEPDARSFRVRDDGIGMSREDARLAVERHATSKIRKFDDLADLTTRGFRGEALAAISSVSRFELTTRRTGDTAGTALKCEGGANLRLEAAGAPEGTTVRVRDLFFNTPARLKFMRKPIAEWGHILKALVRQALTRPDVAFAIRWRDKPYLDLPAGQSLIDRFTAIVPPGAAAGALEADTSVHGVRAWGCIGSPEKTRRDRRHQYFFANGRPIVARPLTFALQEAYRGLLMTQQFPIGAIFLELPGEELDVNVHPTKEEVRFRNEALAAGAIHRAALEALRGAELVPKLDMPRTPGGAWARGSRAGSAPSGRGENAGRIARPGGGSDASPPGFFTSARPSAPAERGEGANEDFVQPDLVGGSASAPGQAPTRSYADDKAAPGGAKDAGTADPDAVAETQLIRRLQHASPRVLAQIELTYILAEAPGVGVVLIDQHAAHEKILYMKFMAQAQRREVQPLMIPYTYQAGPSERASLEALAPRLSAAGFETADLGGGTFAIQSVPLVFDKANIELFIRDLIDEVGGGNLKRGIRDIRHKIGASAACRAAVMSGDPLGREQMQSLLDDVLTTDGALRCPHGRPTIALLTREQLDRQFGRI